MTDNEIIKALECCGNIVDSTCKKCVYHETYNASCVVRLMRDALDLINRQKAEIEDLKKVIETMTNEQFKIGFKARKEIMELLDMCAKQGENAIKEFAERLKEKAPNITEERFHILRNEIDNLVKEMVGDDNA